MTDHESGSRPPVGRSTWLRWATAAVVLALAAGAYARWGDQLSLQALAQQETRLRELQQQHPVGAALAAFLIYVGVTGLGIPGALVLTLGCGWYFGWTVGTVLVSFASTLGATLAFLISRYLFRAAVSSRFAGRLQSFRDSWDRDGAYFLFTLRLIPVAPFFVINLVMGATNISVATFWWVSQLGMLPATIVYVWIGASVPRLQTLADEGFRAALSPRQWAGLTLGLAMLGILPWATRRLIQFQQRSP